MIFQNASLDSKINIDYNQVRFNNLAQELTDQIPSEQLETFKFENI